MSDRHSPAGAAGPATRPPPNSWLHLFPTLPPDVPDALTPVPPAPAFDRFLAVSPAELPAFEPLAVAAGSARERHAVGAALACPDLFLVDVGDAGDGLPFVVDLALEAARAGERVAVLTHAPADADAVVARLAEAEDLLVGRAVAADEPADQLPAASAERTAHAHGPAAVAAAASRLTGTLHRLESERATLAAVRDAIPGLLAACQPADLTAAEVAAAEVAARRAEVAALSAKLASCQSAKSSGVLNRLVGLFSKPAADHAAEVEPQLKAAEQGLAAAQAEADRLAAERSAKLGETERAFRQACGLFTAAGLAPPAAPTAEAVRTAATALDARLAAVTDELASAETTAADLDAHTVVAARRLLAQVRVAVGPVAAVADPLFTAGRFDRVIVADAEHLGDDLSAVTALGSRWVLIGDPTGGGTGGAHRNGRPPRAAPFRRLWDRLHPAGRWETDGVQLVVHLCDAGAEPPTCEPLADRPEIELRFGRDPDGSPLLAAVAFPPTMTLAEAKAFLAAELEEVRLAPCGPARWHESDDAITVRWPAVPDADGDWADLEPGVRERVAGHGPDGLTAAVVFETAAGWSRTAAEEWLARRYVTPRTAALPRPVLVADTPQPRLAGVTV